jgi:hypothetical protein
MIDNVVVPLHSITGTQEVPAGSSKEIRRSIRLANYMETSSTVSIVVWFDTPNPRTQLGSQHIQSTIRGGALFSMPVRVEAMAKPSINNIKELYIARVSRRVR